jgi:hypothetical protein
MLTEAEIRTCVEVAANREHPLLAVVDRISTGCGNGKVFTS